MVFGTDHELSEFVWFETGERPNEIGESLIGIARSGSEAQCTLLCHEWEYSRYGMSIQILIFAPVKDETLVRGL